MRVLVTRPRPAADVLAAALRACGATVEVCPALHITPRALNDAQLANIENADCFVFISVNAVRFGWRPVASRAGVPDVRWCAVGPATARALTAHGVAVIAPPAPGSGAALLALATMQSMCDQRVVIVRGVGGLETLSTVLAVRGARVDSLEVYERTLSPVDTLADALAAGFDVIVVSSGECLAAVLAAADFGGARAALTVATVVVPSPRVLGQARQAGLSRVVLSAGADDAAVLAAVQTIRGHNG